MDASRRKTPNTLIKQTLRESRVTQAQAALDTGIERSRFCMIANGWVVPGSAVRQRISDYLGIPETELFAIGGI